MTMLSDAHAADAAVAPRKAVDPDAGSMPEPGWHKRLRLERTQQARREAEAQHAKRAAKLAMRRRLDTVRREDIVRITVVDPPRTHTAQEAAILAAAEAAGIVGDLPLRVQRHLADLPASDRARLILQHHSKRTRRIGVVAG